MEPEPAELSLLQAAGSLPAPPWKQISIFSSPMLHLQPHDCSPKGHSQALLQMEREQDAAAAEQTHDCPVHLTPIQICSHIFNAAFFILVKAWNRGIINHPLSSSRSWLKTGNDIGKPQDSHHLAASCSQMFPPPQHCQQHPSIRADHKSGNTIH